MEKQNILDPISLRIYIEFLRIELIEKGQKLGLNHQETIYASQELDYFIFEYQKLLSNLNKAQHKNPAIV